MLHGRSYCRLHMARAPSNQLNRTHAMCRPQYPAAHILWSSLPHRPHTRGSCMTPQSLMQGTRGKRGGVSNVSTVLKSDIHHWHRRLEEVDRSARAGGEGQKGRGARGSQCHSGRLGDWVRAWHPIEPNSFVPGAYRVDALGKPRPNDPRQMTALFWISRTVYHDGRTEVKRP